MFNFRRNSLDMKKLETQQSMDWLYLQVLILLKENEHYNIIIISRTLRDRRRRTGGRWGWVSWSAPSLFPTPSAPSPRPWWSSSTRTSQNTPRYPQFHGNKDFRLRLSHQVRSESSEKNLWDTWERPKFELNERRLWHQNSVMCFENI